MSEQLVAPVVTSHAITVPQEPRNAATAVPLATGANR